MRATLAGLALILGAALGASPAPAAPGDVASGRLPGGGTFVVRPTGGTAAAVALWYRTPGQGFDPAAPAPGIGRVAAASVAASKPITGTPLAQQVERLGGRLAVSAYPGSVAITALVPGDRAAAVVRAMTAVYFTPVLDDDGVRIARRDLAEESLLHRFDDAAVLDDALTGALFTAGSTRYSTFPDPTVLRSSTAALRAYAGRAFRAPNATLVVVGPVAANVVDAALAGREGVAEGGEAPLSATVAPRGVAGPPLAVEPRRHGVGLGWVGPPIAAEQDATALDFLADELFRDETGSAVRATSGLGATVEGKFVTYHDPGVFLVTIAGGDVERARALVERAVTEAATPLAPAAFARARAAFVYHILGDTASPAEIADTLGWYTVEGAPEYAPARGTDGVYFRTIAALTPASVAAAAKRYLGVLPLTIDAVPAPSPAASASPAVR